jgi:hypothetical protein
MKSVAEVKFREDRVLLLNEECCRSEVSLRQEFCYYMKSVAEVKFDEDRLLFCKTFAKKYFSVKSASKKIYSKL